VSLFATLGRRIIDHNQTSLQIFGRALLEEVKAFSSEVGTGSREENAINKSLEKFRASEKRGIAQARDQFSAPITRS
jgi:hypothetical protein